MDKIYLHEHPEFKELLEIVARERSIPEFLVEKDYWIMHCLYGLQIQGFDFELKGGTSLSKGFQIIHRFSEDIDLRINPSENENIPTGKNQTKPKHCEERSLFYSKIASKIKIEGIQEVFRDTAFDDKKFLSAGIRLNYQTKFEHLSGVKEGILLELGFAQVTPNIPIDISSWAFDFAFDKVSVIENRAKSIRCYEPGYTFVEKLQAISTKYRSFLENGKMPKNFMRHYYDVYCLLDNLQVQSFIGSDKYKMHKETHFPKADNLVISENQAFLFSNPEITKILQRSYEETSDLYYNGQPAFKDIIEKIQHYQNVL